MKKIKYIIFILFLLISFTGCMRNNNKARITIIATNFPSYDFTRAIIKDVDGVEVKLLVKPGSETHDFEPTPQDIIDIKESDIFIYVGGESDNWIKDIISDLDLDKTRIIRMMDLVELVEEEIIEGMDAKAEDEEYDEHVWTSPENAILIINKIYDSVAAIDSDNISKYKENKEEYVKQIEEIDNEIRKITETSKRKELIFGDRFPFRYFTDYYNLTYYAAFPGCSEQTEASSKTIAFLINQVKKDNIPVILHIELSNKKIANTIASETGATVLEFHSAHNISKEDFDNGITYVDIMKKNIEVLKQALN